MSDCAHGLGVPFKFHAVAAAIWDAVRVDPNPVTVLLLAHRLRPEGGRAHMWVLMNAELAASELPGAAGWHLVVGAASAWTIPRSLRGWCRGKRGARRRG